MAGMVGCLGWVGVVPPWLLERRWKEEDGISGPDVLETSCLGLQGPWALGWDAELPAGCHP